MYFKQYRRQAPTARVSYVPQKQKRREDLEHSLQVEICNYLNGQSVLMPLLYFSVPNALKFLSSLGESGRIAAAYRKMQAEGFKDGVADLVVLMRWRGMLKIAFFEQKRPSTHKTSEKTGKQIIDRPAGKPTESQVDFLEAVKKIGAFSAVSYTIEEFKNHWHDFLNS